jgi:outer membrane receptor protein involved in Fe transport
MCRFLVVSLFAAWLAIPESAVAQTGDGSLRGYVKDEQGAVLPGVTVTATSPALLTPVSGVTDSGGYYRLLNLPPGTYAITAELSGFSTSRREGIIMRAGITLTVDVQLKVGTLSETITVTGDSPMIETGRPTSVLNIDGDLVRAAPITSRRLFSDALDLAPGVGSRNVDDGVGRRAYYFRGSHIYAHAFQLEGAPASAYIDSAAHSMGMGGDTVQDVEMKLGGADASTPLSTGVVLNVSTPRGSNQYKGSTSFSYQPLSWNGDNTKGGAAPGGLPTFQEVNQWDVSLGGRIVRDRVWFYGTYRYADLANGISRTPQDLGYLTAFRSDFTPFDNVSVSHQPFVKLTTTFKKVHELSGFWQYDRNKFTSNRERDTHNINPRGAGGSLYQVKLNSAWSTHLQTMFSASYNDKGGAEEDTYKDYQGFGPSVQVHQTIRISGGVPTGSGTLVTMNNNETISIQPSSMVNFRGDLTYYQESWGGRHTVKTGIWGAPSLKRSVLSRALNDGFTLERRVQRDPNNAAAGLVAYHRRYQSPLEVLTTDARDRDIGIYAQDTWQPNGRLTVNFGVRADFVRRFDDIFGVVRMKSTNIGPRVGGAYMISEDGKNVVRAFFGRVHEQVNGRDPITTFGPTSRRFQRDIYDANGDGVFETEVITPAATVAINQLAFDPKLHQPFVDEYALGFAKQFPGQMSLDLSFNRRNFKDAYGEVDINGMYPDGPNQPFGGFGRVDPNQGMIMQQTNAAWSKVVVTSVEAILAKNLSHNFQVVGTATRQWQHLDGTWNPTDPARFIQPNAFANDRDLSRHLFGNGDDNSLDGGGAESGVAYRPYSVRLAGQYFAPWQVRVAASYVIQAGGFLGPVVVQNATGDPVFGPSTVRLANGATQSNPLATSWRFAYATRSEGQVRNETTRYLQLNLARTFKFGQQSVETGFGIFNVFNTGAHTQWNTGANRLNNDLYLSRFNRHPPRAFQLTLSYKF